MGWGEYQLQIGTETVHFKASSEKQDVPSTSREILSHVILGVCKGVSSRGID